MKSMAPWRVLIGAGVCVVAGWVAVASAHVDFPEAKSAAAAKELAALLDSKKLDGYAAKDGAVTKWVAVSYAPGERMLAVAMTYDRPGDLEYFFNQKDFGSIYRTLRAAAFTSTDGFIVDDAQANGLVPQPKKNQPDDDVLFGSVRKTFDGVFNEPKKTDPKKPSFDDYLKTFTDADERYTHILTVITGELKKG
jgi:hypothetical protein